MNHSYLAEFMTPFRHMAMPHGLSGALGMHVMNLGLTQQAAMIAFINIFCCWAYSASPSSRWCCSCGTEDAGRDVGGCGE